MYPWRHGGGFNVYHSNNRVVGFAGPFLLGALTGGVATAAFNPYRPRPVGPVYGPGLVPYGPRPPFIF